MPDVMMSDRRVSPRYPLMLIEVTGLAASATLTGRTSDVSRTGCYIDTLNPLPSGSEVHVRLQNEKEFLEVNARIMYVSPKLGMGVMFAADIPAEQLAILDGWLAAAGKPLR
jgi:positive regulator of sigma E activity